MDITRLLKLMTIIIANGIVNVHSYSMSPLSTSKDKWSRANVLEQDELHQTLMSIEERLRIVDSVRYGINRLEISIDRINNKMDSMETRISRLHTQMDGLESRGRQQSVMQMKLDTMSQDLNSAELKLEMLPDQLVAKVGNSQDRLLLRINSLESKIESLFNKIQGSQNDVSNKFQTAIESQTTQLTNALEEVRQKSVTLENRLNITAKESLQHLMNIESKVAKNEQVQMLTSRLDGINNHLNQTDGAQNDSPRMNDVEKDRMVNSLKSELHTEAQKIISKFGNIYNEASKRLYAIENAVREHIQETNGTQKEMKDKLRQIIRIHKDCEGHRRSVYYGFLDVKIEDIKSYMRTNFNNLYDKLDGSNRKMTNLQAEFLESCSTTQGLEEFERRILTVVDRMHHTLNNKTEKVDKQTNDLLTLLKSYGSQAQRTENTVMRIAHEIKDDRKKVHNAINEMLEQEDSSFLAIQVMKHDIEKLLKRNLTLTRQAPDGVKPGKPGNGTDANFNPFRAVEVHHTDGVVKLLTENHPSASNTTTILALGHTMNITGGEVDEIFKMTTKDEEDEEDDLDSDYTEPNPDETEQSKDIPEEFVTKIAVDYIKLIRGQMNLTQFLQDANLDKSYNSLPEMIQDLRDVPRFPPFLIEELSQYRETLPENDDDIFAQLRSPEPDEDEDKKFEEYVKNSYS